MFVHTTPLRYWKSERADISTCEDAFAQNSASGLFAVADGAGTTLFSNIWADILVQQFVTRPLLSDDVFEMEWWVRQAQPVYTGRVPPVEKLDWNAQEKARKQGAYTTLATLRVSRVTPQSAEAELLVIGDSCVIIGRPSLQEVKSFPLQEASEFDRAPFCVPALLRNLNRNGLNCRRLSYPLLPDDIVILATDAVSRWIVSGANETMSQWQAFMQVAEQTEGSWPIFIRGCRERREMVDDDVTALILRFQEQQEEGAVSLGTTTEHSPEVREQRRKAFADAKGPDNKELMAIVYGDGKDFIQPLSESKEILDAREVANALKEVMQALRDALANGTNVAKKLEPIWWKNEKLLASEPCAENLRKSLAANGVRLQREQHVPKHEIAPTAPGASPVSSVVPHMNLPAKSPVVATPPLASNLTIMENGVSRQVDLSTPLPPEDMDKTISVNALNTPAEIRKAYAESQALTAQRHQALLKFREAIRINDDRKIVESHDSYEAVGGDSSELTLEEQKRFQTALRKTFSDEREITRLKERLIEAYRNDNDDEILAVVREIKNSPYADNIQFTPRELERIRVAEQRKVAFASLVEVLHEGTARQKVDAFVPDVQNYPKVNAEDKEQIALAQRLVEAYKNGDNEAICAAYGEIEFSPYRKYFLFTREEQQRIRTAQNDLVALRHFHSVLDSGGAAARLLLHCYDAIHRLKATLSEDERYQVRLAERLLDSFDKNDDAILSKLSYANSYSPYPLAFTDRERQSIRRARQQFPLTVPVVVMIIEQKDITIEQFLDALHVKRFMLNRQLAKLQNSPATEQSDQQRNAIEARISSQHFIIQLFSDLEDDMLIRMSLEKMNQRKDIEKDTGRRAKQIIDDFKNAKKSDYDAFMRTVKEEKMQEVVSIFARLEAFEEYLLKLPTSISLAEWLAAKRKTIDIRYPNSAELDEAQLVSERNLCWVFRWKPIRDAYPASTEERRDQGGQNYA